MCSMLPGEYLIWIPQAVADKSSKGLGENALDVSLPSSDIKYVQGRAGNNIVRLAYVSILITNPSQTCDKRAALCCFNRT